MGSRQRAPSAPIRSPSPKSARTLNTAPNEFHLEPTVVDVTLLEPAKIFERDGLTVTSAQTLLHERRLKEHQQWMEDMERAFAKMAALDEIHSENMAEFDEKMTQLAAAQLLTEEGLGELKEGLTELKNMVKSFLEGLGRGGNEGV